MRQIIRKASILSKENLLMLIAYAPLVGFLPTWWITVFGKGGGEAIEVGQWWMFVLSNIAAFKLLEKNNWRMRLLYAIWVVFAGTMQLAIWLR